MRDEYLNMLRVHVEDGGRLSHQNGLDLLGEVDRLKKELERAYRTLRGLYGCAVRGELPGTPMLGYHSLTIAAALRFVHEGSLDGSTYFEGKPVDVLHDVLRVHGGGQ